MVQGRRHDPRVLGGRCRECVHDRVGVEWPGIPARPYKRAASAYTPGCFCLAPRWVRLVRQGDSFSGYESADGSEWRLVGTETIAMAPTVYVGLAVTSHNVFATSAATFTDVTVGATAVPRPTVAILEPLAGASFTAPASVVVSAAATGMSAPVARVDFYSGSAPIGTAFAEPFSIAWSAVPAGTYALAAVATDSNGATAVSLPVTFTVALGAQGQPYRPTTLIFGASADNDSNVTSYSVELRLAIDPPTAPPVASRNLGKPPVVNGEISVDISATVDALADGSYYAVVVTTGPGGTTPSAPSPGFSK